MPDHPGYTAWLQRVPLDERRDPLWRVEAYRLARFSVELAWPDACAFYRARLGQPVASQLWRAASAIAPDIAEGYSRSSVADRIRFLEYAVGSTREAIAWYRSAAHVLPSRDTSVTTGTLASVRNLLLRMIASQRKLLRRDTTFGT